MTLMTTVDDAVLKAESVLTIAVSRSREESVEMAAVLLIDATQAVQKLLRPFVS